MLDALLQENGCLRGGVAAMDAERLAEVSPPQHHPATHCLITPTAHRSPPTAHRPSPTAHHPRPTAHRQPPHCPTTHRPPPTASQACVGFGTDDKKLIGTICSRNKQHLGTQIDYAELYLLWLYLLRL